MPTVMRIDAARVAVYPHDHLPEHVHVRLADAEAIFLLNCPAGPVTLRTQRGFTSGQIARYRAALNPHAATLCAAWEAIYADR